MTGNAAIQAAERARDVIALHAGKKLDAPLERVTFAAGRVFDVQDPERGLTFAEAEVTRSSGASRDRKSTRLNSSHSQISYAVFCLKKTNIDQITFGVNVLSLSIRTMVTLLNRNRIHVSKLSITVRRHEMGTGFFDTTNTLM